MIYDALLNQTDAGKNNNKFYRIQLLVSTTGTYRTWTRWARVGDIGQTKVLGDGSLESALAHYNKKFKDKSGLTWDNRLDPPKANRYTFLERNYDGGDENDSNADSEDDAQGDTDDEDINGLVVAGRHVEKSNALPVAESKLTKPVQRLMEMIFNRHFFARTMGNSLISF